VVPGLDALLAAVDHLPLAVELLAAWSTILPLSALARAVAHELHALEVARRDLPDRHRSLARVVHDSVARLTPADAAALSTPQAATTITVRQPFDKPICPPFSRPIIAQSFPGVRPPP
jgi:hypothetical protein